ncbi:2OG-Fe(II) oxygenase [Stella sp.]|uniref:2OG-Fe(II) oxygenase n=1 Tax=Stella sp. TaxID=2912054 RepID=UPI0035B4ED39
MTTPPLADRIARVDWAAAAAALDATGHAVLPHLLTEAEAMDAIGLFDAPEPGRFRREVVMERHGYGRGVYRYFADPLPPVVQTLRTQLYPPLATVADRWAERLGLSARFPRDHAAYRARCHAAGQTRPTPLLLRYGPGDYNCLHQDLYGEEVFPIQAVALLSRPGADFAGGEFVLVEQQPRRQSRAHVVPLDRGDVALFAVRDRPQPGRLGWRRTQLRHGVATLRSGSRTTLGIIFHDAA